VTLTITNVKLGKIKEHMTRQLNLPNGEYILVTFTNEGVVYDRYNQKDELQEAYGYDYYADDLGFTISNT